MASTSQRPLPPLPPPIYNLPPPPHKRISLPHSTTSPRRQYLYRLHDALHLCLERGDIDRAARCWAILVRCAEVDWLAMWEIGLAVVADKGRYLKEVQGLDIKHSPAILLAYILHLLQPPTSSPSTALSELELYLPTMPYSDDPALHECAGMICISLASQQKAKTDGRESGGRWGEEDDDSSEDDTEDVDGDGTSGKKAQPMDHHLRSLSASPYYGRAKNYFRRTLQLDADRRTARTYFDIMTDGKEEDDTDSSV